MFQFLDFSKHNLFTYKNFIKGKHAHLCTHVHKWSRPEISGKMISNNYTLHYWKRKNASFLFSLFKRWHIVSISCLIIYWCFTDLHSLDTESQYLLQSFCQFSVQQVIKNTHCIKYMRVYLPTTWLLSSPHSWDRSILSSSLNLFLHTGGIRDEPFQS